MVTFSPPSTRTATPVNVSGSASCGPPRRTTFLKSTVILEPRITIAGVERVADFRAYSPAARVTLRVMTMPAAGRAWAWGRSPNTVRSMTARNHQVRRTELLIDYRFRHPRADARYSLISAHGLHARCCGCAGLIWRTGQVPGGTAGSDRRCQARGRHHAQERDLHGNLAHRC